MTTTQVIRDKITDTWRVLCPAHGEIARYSDFWAAARDAESHDKNCGMNTGK